MATTGTAALAPQTIASSTVSTDAMMSKVTELYVCYASSESGGDSADDYVALDATFLQVSVPTYWPNRTVTGAAQNFNITGGVEGDEVAWSTGTTCSAGTLSGGATTTKTVIYTLVASNYTYQDVTLHATARADTWNFCYKPAGSTIWSLISGAEFVSVSKPTTSPPVSVAGSITPVTFSDATDGDFVVMQLNNCDNAHQAVTGPSFMGPQHARK